MVQMKVGKEYGVYLLGVDILGGQVGHELAFPSPDGFDGAWAVAGIDENRLSLGTDQVAPDFDEHVVLYKSVGIAFPVGRPSLQRRPRKKLGEGHREWQIHIGEGDYLNATHIHREIRHFNPLVFTAAASQSRNSKRCGPV